MPYLGAMKFQMTRFSQVGAIVLGAGVLHLAMLACNGGDSETAAHAGSGGSTSAGTATGGTSASGTPSGTGGSSGSGCGCQAQPEVIDAPCVLNMGTMPSPGNHWIARVDMPGRTAESLASTIALGTLVADTFSTIPDGESVDYVTAPIVLRGTTILVNCEKPGTTVQMLKAVRFVVPAK